jgi:hypothetical protein
VRLSLLGVCWSCEKRRRYYVHLNKQSLRSKRGCRQPNPKVTRDTGSLCAGQGATVLWGWLSRSAEVALERCLPKDTQNRCQLPLSKSSATQHFLCRSHLQVLPVHSHHITLHFETPLSLPRTSSSSALPSHKLNGSPAVASDSKSSVAKKISSLLEARRSFHRLVSHDTRKRGRLQRGKQ